MKVRIKWRDHLSSGNTFNLLGLLRCFYQHMHYNAINQFNKTMRLELPFVSCGRATQEAKCPGSQWESGLWTCLQLLLSSFSSFRFGLVSSAQNQPDLEPPETPGAGAQCHWERSQPGTWRRTREKHWGAAGSSRDGGLCEMASQSIAVAFQAPDPYWRVAIHCHLSPGVLHWHGLGCRRARKVWRPQPTGRPPGNEPAHPGATC